VNKYRKLQIIKHALQYYITRPDAESKDIEQEKALLEKVKGEIRAVKSKWYGDGAKE
jgi:uncharacterized protein YukE